MPWNIAKTDGHFRIVFSGTVCDRDLTEAFDAVEQIEAASGIPPHRISDLSGADGINLTFESIMMLVRRRKQVPLSHPIKSAVVTSDALQFGFARMFHTLNDHPMVTVQLFTRESEAVAWVREE